MTGDTTTFRPRNGLSAEGYWRIRAWCQKNGFSFSDVLNALMYPVAYYLENHCEVDKQRNMAKVILNVGTLSIPHVFGGKMYPLATEQSGDRETVTQEIIQEKVALWMERNKEKPTLYDKIHAEST